jgi:hypothetical protein
VGEAAELHQIVPPTIYPMVGADSGAARRMRLGAWAALHLAKRGRIQHDLSITSQMLRVGLDGTGRILPAHVGCRIGLVGS